MTALLEGTTVSEALTEHHDSPELALLAHARRSSELTKSWQPLRCALRISPYHKFAKDSALKQAVGNFGVRATTALHIAFSQLATSKTVMRKVEVITQRLAAKLQTSHSSSPSRRLRAHTKRPQTHRSGHGPPAATAVRGHPELPEHLARR